MALVLVAGMPCFAECAPLMRGGLWWVTGPYYDWTEAQFAETIRAQRAVGFDLLWLLNCQALLQRASRGEGEDVLEQLFDLADSEGMDVVVDLPRAGWYGESEVDSIVSATRTYVEAIASRYGDHDSFHGWYLNYEINPIAAEDTDQTAYWRAAWKGIVEACHESVPGSVVTISPFFLLDKNRRRGFVYQHPDEYARWWGETLKATGIDVLMLQDSGEHLGFFSLNDREPFWSATATACHEAGAEFWLNVECAEVPAESWDEYLEWERAGQVRYEVLPIDKLKAKLRLAARYADSIVNWGYFPYMNPLEPEPSRVEGAAAAYDSYKKYVESVSAQR